MEFRKLLVANDPESPEGGAVRAARLAAAAGAEVIALHPTGCCVPAVEIVRAAEDRAADLIILEREPMEVIEGAVRRSRVPCLVVPAGQTVFGRVLAAVDAGPDSNDVLEAALAIAALTGGPVAALHVEHRVLVAAGREYDRPAWTPAAPCDLIVRQGDPVAEILRVVRQEAIEVLVHGHHRGGPRNGHETGSVAARLLHRAPCAVLTVPI